jgi:peptide/nickel transport system ATP-binding protein
MSSPLLQIKDLDVSIGRLEILRGVSLDVEAGAAVGLVGETGSGKTMTVRAACGLLARAGARAVNGSIAVAGEDVTCATERTWRRFRGRTLALVPQSSMSGLDPLMSVGRQLKETVKLLRPDETDADAEVARLLGAVSLEPDRRLLQAYSHELSGGMRQRVMIALALAGDPKLLVADEPTTALDATIQTEIVQLLLELQRERDLGLLVVSHDIGLIEAMTAVTVVMYAGRVVEIGPTQEVLRSPAHPYTKALLEALPERAEPGERLAVIAGQPPAPGEVRTGCAFAPRCPQADAACFEREPALIEIAPGRRVACVLYDGSGR